MTAVLEQCPDGAPFAAAWLIATRAAFNNCSSMFGLPRAVWIFGWVSLATDAASEAIYPLLPFFLVQILGAGVVSLGIIEGAAEAVNSVLKIVSGRLADRTASKRRLVLVGYTLSSAVRPLIAVTGNWTQVFAIRLLDRVGKGIRTAPRDAMLAAWATPANRGRIYGFHRAMDHTGAVVGPLLATAFLFFNPGEYRQLFALAIVPGAIAVALVFLVRNEGTAAKSVPPNPSASSPDSIDGLLARDAGGSKPLEDRLPRRFRNYMFVVVLFTLGNSTDAFLLLKLTDAAGSAQYVPMMWAALHVVKAALSVVGGSWSDRVGRRTVIAIGWIVYAVVYFGFAVSTSLAALLALFMVYGCYFGFTEGTEKALVADLAPASRRGYAFGIFTAVQGIGALAASISFGLIWNAAGPAAAFMFGAVLALAATVLLFVAVPMRT